MARSLVIVESPAKAKTISRFLGDGFEVRASVGHVADLPSKGLAVDVDNGFKPTYELTTRGKDVVKELRAALKDADELYLATDEDREGEAISWHLLEALKPAVPVKRMVFHEITRRRDRRGGREPRASTTGWSTRPETRRILDRLYGYEVSPVLWKKVNAGLSAGRVQSPATRLVVEREWERIRFVPAGYWDIEANFATDPGFAGTLVASRVSASRRAATSTRTVEPKRDDVRIVDETLARGLARRGSSTVLQCALGRREAVPVDAEGAVHDLDAPAGGRAQAQHERRTGDASRAGPVRARLHHLHAHRLDDAVRDGGHAARIQINELVRRRVPAGQAPHAREEGRRTPRRPTRRSGPPARRSDSGRAGERAQRRPSLRLYEMIWKRTLA